MMYRGGEIGPRTPGRRAAQRLIGGLCLATGCCLALFAVAAPSAHAAGAAQTRFQRVPTQYIAALGAPDASSGRGAQAWGLWALDPGPRGVRLGRYERLKDAGGVAPAGWKFSGADWWLEENGLIMEQPVFPVPARKYLVTGGRAVRAVLTIHPADSKGDRRWELDEGATLHDVTHLACRSARYVPATAGAACSPAQAQQAAFPVAPGGVMPAVAGCAKQDYAVLVVIGIAVAD